MRLVSFIPFILLVIITGLMLWHSLQKSPTIPHPLLGLSIPAFTLVSTDPTEKHLDEKDFIGSYSLVNIFASWCVSCLAEHPLLLSLKNANILPIYGINWKDNRDDLDRWLTRHDNPYTKIGFDYHGDAVTALGVTGAPETFLIDPAGTIIFHHTGPLNEQTLNKQILPMIVR